MEVWLTKLISLVVLLLAAIISGLLSVKLLNVIGWRGRGSRRSKATMLVDGLNCFAGGVFFATSMIHLLPDVREDIAAILDTLKQKTEFPLAEFLTCIGVFVVMFLEQSMVHCRQGCSKKKKERESYRSEESLELLVVDKSQEPETNDISQTQSIPPLQNENRCNGGVGEETPAHASSDRPSQNQSASSSRVTRSLVLLLALSTHTVFEGLALGLQETARDVWTLFTAILLHKLIMSFAAGLRFAESLRNTLRTVLCLIAFSIMAPIGVGVGLAVTEVDYQGLATKMASAVLQGLATGTFIYVTFFEILMEQMTKNQSILKVIFAFVGFACIAALNMIT